MKIVDESALKECRGWHCEVCGYGDRWAVPHHIFSRGAGRVDIRWNLIAVCPVCHWDIHNGDIPQSELLRIVALRDGTTPEAIREEVARIRRLDKDGAEVKRPTRGKT